MDAGFPIRVNGRRQAEAAAESVVSEVVEDVQIEEKNAVKVIAGHGVSGEDRASTLLFLARKKKANPRLVRETMTASRRGLFFRKGDAAARLVAMQIARDVLSMDPTLVELAQASTKDSSPDVRLAALQLLREAGAEDDCILESLDDADDHVLAAALAALRMNELTGCSLRKAIHKTCSIVADSKRSNFTRLAAIRLLDNAEKYSSADIAYALASTAQDESADIELRLASLRSPALFASSKHLPPPGVLAFLDKLALSDPSPSIRAEADYTRLLVLSSGHANSHSSSE